MLKLGIFGDQTTNPELLEQLKTAEGVEISGVYFSGNAVVPKSFNELPSPIGLMDISDAILILSDKSISNDLVRLILRKSKHVYLKTIPNLYSSEIKELIDLEKEAGIVTFIYNPFNYVPYFDPFVNRYEKPVLINLRTSFEGLTIKPAHEMLLLVTAINRVVKSNHKELDIFGICEPDNQLVVNLRIEFDNGSVVNLTLTQEKTPGYCEVFEQDKRTRFEFEAPLFVSYTQLYQEYKSMADFLRLIHVQDKKTNSFDRLLNGVQMVDEIREHLRFNGISF